jgi:hypothetical protein
MHVVLRVARRKEVRFRRKFTVSVPRSKRIARLPGGYSGLYLVNKMSVRWPLTLILVLCLALSMPWQEARGLPRDLVTDPVTGFAAAGFDSVAYFSDGRARPGKADLEVMWRGAGWRFVNEGNRAAFVADPDVYAPSFGGYCAVAVSRGFLAEGNPEIWEVHGDRLYFFYSEAHRQVFLMDADHIVAEAAAFWGSRSRR